MRADAFEKISVERRALGVAAWIERQCWNTRILGETQRRCMRLVARDEHDLDR